jgi:iron complex transport system ATP-binding protein
MHNPALILSELAIGYTDGKCKHQVVDTINASLFDGELVSLIGSNGAGKSTLLRTVSAFQRPLSGEILYRNLNEKIDAAAQLSRHIAIVLTGREPIYNLTVREVIAMGRTPYTGFFGKSTARDREIIEESMATLGITHLSERPIEAISDGERQKTMIAKALAQQTPIILLDEPTAFLDFISRVHLMQTLRRLAHESRKAILLSTHDLELALQLSDRLWLIDKGQLHSGSVEELSANGTLPSFIDSDGIRYDRKEKKIIIT